MSATSKRQHVIAERISDAFVRAYNTGELDAIDDAVTEDFVCHHLAAGVDLHGAEEYKTRITDLREGFSDFSISEELLVVDGDRGAAQYRWGGTHDGEFSGIPATGKPVNTTSVTLMRMDGDRLGEMWIYGDNAGIMSQLGIER